MTKKNVSKNILDNAEKLTKMHSLIQETAKNKKNDPAAWEKACQEFHAAYDSLAFPGGLEHGMAALKKQDPATITIAIEYLNANPYFHRSGYIQEKILRFLKQAPLTTDHIAELQDILIAQIMSEKPSGNYQEYCRLAAKIADENLRTKVEKIIEQSHDERVMQRARTMLDLLGKNR